METSSLSNNSGTGLMSTLSNIFKNPATQDYLAVLAKAIGEDKPVGPALADKFMANQSATSQANLTDNYMKILSGMFKGDIPKDGKIVQTADGIKIDMPATAFGNSNSNSNQSSGQPEQSALGRLVLGEQNAMDRNITNPFDDGQQGINPSNLVGLTPQDVSRALAGAIGIEDLKQTGEYRKAKAGEVNALDQFAPVRMPGIDRPITLREWQSLPTGDREYALYAHQQEVAGNDVLSKDEFLKTKPTSREKFLRKAMDDPALMESAKELAKAGAPTIGEITEKTKAVEQAKDTVSLTSPDFVQKIVKDLSKDERKWRAQERTAQLMTAPKYAHRQFTKDSAREFAQREMILREMDRRIRAHLVGKPIEFREETGWYLNGELIVRNPYGR